jgi:hypothetical protein
VRPIDDPALLTVDARLREIAAILAAGIVRLRARAALPAKSVEPRPPENPSEPAPDGLEVRSETPLSVHDG